MMDCSAVWAWICILVCMCGYMCCSVLILLGLKETGAAFENHLHGLRLGVASGDLGAL